MAKHTHLRTVDARTTPRVVVRTQISCPPVWFSFSCCVFFFVPPSEFRFSFYVCMENAGESMIESAVLQACATSAGIDGDAI